MKLTKENYKEELQWMIHHGTISGTAKKEIEEFINELISEYDQKERSKQNLVNSIKGAIETENETILEIADVNSNAAAMCIGAKDALSSVLELIDEYL